ncbi:MAG: hypothetical protein P8X68_03555 [Desulfobacterales bacterium]
MAKGHLPILYEIYICWSTPKWSGNPSALFSLGAQGVRPSGQPPHPRRLEMIGGKIVGAASAPINV